GLVASGVAEGGAEDDRDVQGGEALGDDLLAASGILARGGEVADDESLGFLEGAAEEELGEEAVEPVGRLVQVLEEDDAAAELRLKRSPAHGSEAREIAAGKRPFDAALAR